MPACQIVQTCGSKKCQFWLKIFDPCGVFSAHTIISNEETCLLYSLDIHFIISKKMKKCFLDTTCIVMF